MHDQSIKLFFAIRPPPGVAPYIEDLGEKLRRAHRLKGRLIGRDRLHATLAPVMLPGCPLQNAVRRATAAGDALRANRFDIRFEWTESFRNRDRHPFVLRGETVMKPFCGFRATLTASMAQQGLPVLAGFTPHITLLWADRCADAYPIAPIDWQVSEFALILSLQGRSQHIPIAEWQLR